MAKSVQLQLNKLKYQQLNFVRRIPLLTALLIFSTAAFAQQKTGATSFVMCEVMPAADVAAKSPFTIPLTGTQAWPTKEIKTGCQYKFKGTDDEASIAIGLTNLSSSPNAAASFNNTLNDCRQLWDEEPEKIINLGDTAFFCGKDNCGIKVLLGKYILDINFGGQFPDVPDQRKKEAGIALAHMVIERLGYLLNPLKKK